MIELILASLSIRFVFYRQKRFFVKRSVFCFLILMEKDLVSHLLRIIFHVKSHLFWVKGVSISRGFARRFWWSDSAVNRSSFINFEINSNFFVQDRQKHFKVIVVKELVELLNQKKNLLDQHENFRLRRFHRVASTTKKTRR